MPRTPLVASVAPRETVALEMYQPLLPDVPTTAALDAGSAVSIEMVRLCTISLRPAPSVALKSSVCTPSPSTAKDCAYWVHVPLSNRYQIESGGDVPFMRSKVTLTADVYQPDEPAVPIRTARESSTIPMIVPLTTENSFAASALPARSKEKYTTECVPMLGTRKGSV